MKPTAHRLPAGPARPSPLRPKLLVAACLAFVLTQLIPVLGPVMRESDQASILYGAVRLADGRDTFHGVDYYNYDKQFISYWLAAAARQLAPRADFVTLCNVTGFSLFWGGVAVLLLRRLPSRWEAAAAVVACLLAPTLWLHSPFYSTPFVSGGFLLLAWAVWRRSRVAAFGLVFLAVGARADALLALPWFAWTVTPLRPAVRLVRSPGPLLLLAAGLAAFLFGRAIYAGLILDVTEPFFYPKIYAAYVIFGLGAATLAFLWLGAGLGRASWRRLRRGRLSAAGFYLLGLGALLLPWAYYSFQLYSTRYWTVLLCALLGGLLTRRGAALLATAIPARRPRGLLAAATIACAVIPVFVGVRLPYPLSPRLVTRQPTLFPTGDGLQPMGALRGYFHAMTDHGGSIDHNQPTWLAATRADLQADATGMVPVLTFSLRSYVELTVALQGRSVHLVPEDAPFFYSDARDLLRTWRDGDGWRAFSRLKSVAALDVTPAGPAVDGYRIVRASHQHPPGRDWVVQMALARLFEGNEYRFVSGGEDAGLLQLPDPERGKTIVLFSDQPFAAEIAGAVAPVAVTRLTESGLYVATVPGRAWDGAGIRIQSGRPALALAIHPDYMNVNRVR